MKNWMQVAWGLVAGLLAAGLLWLVASPPRGESVQLRPPPTLAPLVVYVSGAVTHPGVYALPQGSRVREAIEYAGGLLPEADAAGLNLAARLEDGMHIQIASAAASSAAQGQTALSTGSEPTPTFTGSQIILPSQASESPKVNINTATQRELETLPGIGPVTAQKIITYREEHGPFKTVEELLNVSGIGPATLEKIRGEITVEE